MSTIYRERTDVPYAEMSCTSCGVRVAVSSAAREFYAHSAPFQPYMCPTCRKRRDPDAALYAEAPRQEVTA